MHIAVAPHKPDAPRSHGGASLRGGRRRHRIPAGSACWLCLLAVWGAGCSMAALQRVAGEHVKRAHRSARLRTHSMISPRNRGSLWIFQTLKIFWRRWPTRCRHPARCCCSPARCFYQHARVFPTESSTGQLPVWKSTGDERNHAESRPAFSRCVALVAVGASALGRGDEATAQRSARVGRVGGASEQRSHPADVSGRRW